MEIEDFEITKNLEVNIVFNNNGQITDISNRNLNKIPVQFNKVEGTFKCSNNNLKTLKGCPRVVQDDFYCCNNKITDMKHCPEYIYVDAFFDNNLINTLEYHPKIVSCVLSLIGNPLIFENLKYARYEDIEDTTIYHDFKESIHDLILKSKEIETVNNQYKTIKETINEVNNNNKIIKKL